MSIEKRKCKCGCGRTFIGTAKRKWFSDACKQKAYRDSMDGEQATHKTVHEDGINNWPSFYVNRAAKKLSSTVSIKGSEM